MIDGYVRNMDLHMCTLVQSYKDFQVELYSKITGRNDFNYVAYIEKVRILNFMPKSDVEIVIVDENSVLYHNTIIQLKLMGYTEILEIDKRSGGQLYIWYQEF